MQRGACKACICQQAQAQLVCNDTATLALPTVDYNSGPHDTHGSSQNQARGSAPANPNPDFVSRIDNTSCGVGSSRPQGTKKKR